MYLTLLLIQSRELKPYLFLWLSRQNALQNKNWTHISYFKGLPAFFSVPVNFELELLYGLQEPWKIQCDWNLKTAQHIFILTNYFNAIIFLGHGTISQGLSLNQYANKLTISHILTQVKYLQKCSTKYYIVYSYTTNICTYVFA